jgi:hypothetical protein
VSIDGVPVVFKVDTGAQCNVLPRNIFDKVVKLKQLTPGPRVTAYNRQPVRVLDNNNLTWFITVANLRLVVFG